MSSCREYPHPCVSPSDERVLVYVTLFFHGVRMLLPRSVLSLLNSLPDIGGGRLSLFLCVNQGPAGVRASYHTPPCSKTLCSWCCGRKHVLLVIPVLADFVASHCSPRIMEGRVLGALGGPKSHVGRYGPSVQHLGLQIHLTNTVAASAACRVLRDTVLHPESCSAGGGDRHVHKYLSHEAGCDD